MAHSSNIEVQPGGSRRRYHVILNANSGTAHATGITGAGLAESFAQQNLPAIVDDDVDIPLEQRIAKAISGDAEVIVAAGGDGTVTAIASAIVHTDKALAILPLGTINLLARDLCLPLDPLQAVAGLAALQPRRMDVGEVNGRIFLHKVVLGFIPGVAAGREQLRGHENLGAKIGFLRYFYRRLIRARRMAVQIEYNDGEARIERVLALAVANNAYDEGLGHFFSRQRLDGGNLSLYLLKRMSPTDLVRLTAEMLIGKWRQDDALKIESVRSVTIRTKKPTLKAMIDGEVESLTAPFVFRIRPTALSILAPIPAEAPTAAATAELVADTGT